MKPSAVFVPGRTVGPCFVEMQGLRLAKRIEALLTLRNQANRLWYGTCTIARGATRAAQAEPGREDDRKTQIEES